MTPRMTPHDHEAQRQQLLLRALWRLDSPASLSPHLADHPAWPQQGLQRALAAYQAAAGAAAQRALAAAYPVVQALLGDTSFAALARALWLAQPPTQGDMALWGEALPQFMQQSADLAAEPYLPDVARLEWAVHRAQSAADDTAPSLGLQRLAQADLSALRVLPRAGTALVSSPHPVHSIWCAHQAANPGIDPFAPARAALARAQSEHALVQRKGFDVQVHWVPQHQATFTAAVINGLSLGQALQQADAQFEFEPWLVAALEQDWVASIA
jgi:Putative DNA-binding domain